VTSLSASFGAGAHDFVAVLANSLSSSAPVLRRVLSEGTFDRLLDAPAVPGPPTR
jgi:hypothetical protein